MTLELPPFSPDDASLIDDFNTSWLTNVMGPIHTTNAFLPLLRKGTLKKIMTISSGVGDPALTLESGFAVHTSYAVSKCALEMVNVKFAREFSSGYASQPHHLHMSL